MATSAIKASTKWMSPAGSSANRRFPPRILSVGGRLGYVDDAETPNSLITIHDYEKAPLIMEVRGLPTKAGAKNMDTYEGASIGIVIECEGGHVVVSDYRGAKAFDKKGKQIAVFDGVSSHFENFIHAVRSRKESDLHAPIREGHLSSALCHTANISYRLGALQAPAAIRDHMRSNPAASATFERLAQHLRANNIDLESAKLTLGQHLHMNPVSETFTNHSPADALLTREYRKPFVVA